MHEMKEKLSDICEMKKKIVDWAEMELATGFSENYQHIVMFGEIVDMIKDLAEAEKACHEACYYEMMAEGMKNGNGYPMHNERMGYNPRMMETQRMKPVHVPMMDDHQAKSYGIDAVGRYDRMMSDEDEEYDDRHGRAFNKFRKTKRHYHETHSDADRKQMKDYANEHLMETIGTLKEIWEDADPDLRKRMKTDLTKLTAEMTV